MEIPDMTVDRAFEMLEEDLKRNPHWHVDEAHALLDETDEGEPLAILNVEIYREVDFNVKGFCYFEIEYSPIMASLIDKLEKRVEAFNKMNQDTYVSRYLDFTAKFLKS